MPQVPFLSNILAILACLLWASAFFSVKLGLAHISPLFFAGTRFILSGIILFPLYIHKKQELLAIKANIMYIVLIALLQTALLYALFFLGMQIVDGALAAIIIGSSPLVTAILAHYLMADEKMSISQFLILMTGIIGIIIISFSRKPWTAKGLSTFGGIFMLLIGVCCSSISNIIISKNKQRLNPVTLNSVQILIGGILLFCSALIFEPLPGKQNMIKIIPNLIHLSLVSAAGFTLWFHLLKTVKVSDLNVWKFLMPLFGALFSWLFVPGELPDPFSLSGMVLIVSSILLYARYMGGKQKRQAEVLSS